MNIVPSLAFFFLPNLETTILAVSFCFIEITQSVSGVYVFFVFIVLPQYSQDKKTLLSIWVVLSERGWAARQPSGSSR